jgi:hypothetical protein
MSDMKNAKLVLDSRCGTGESPVWDDEASLLFSRIFRAVSFIASIRQPPGIMSGPSLSRSAAWAFAGPVAFSSVRSRLWRSSISRGKH